MPRVRTHGFAMTSLLLITRYPWWSVDSSSWVKLGAYGFVYIPRMKGGKFDFTNTAMQIRASNESIGTVLKNDKTKKRHICVLKRSSPHTYKIILEWLDFIQIPLGKTSPEGEILERGILNSHLDREVANLRFFEALCKSLPAWPWPFYCRKNRSAPSFNLIRVP